MKTKFRFGIILTLVCLFACSSISFLGCKKTSNSISNWDNLSISNFSNYRALCAGCVESSAKKGDNSLYVAYAEGKDDAGEVKLVGITGTNECEEITFVNDKGEITKQNARLIWFDAYTRYSFVCFSTDSDAEYVSEIKHERKSAYDTLSYTITSGATTSGDTGTVNVNYGYRPTSSVVTFRGYFFIIDNVTGKIYDVAIILKESKYHGISLENMENDFDYIMFLPHGAKKEIYFINFDNTNLYVEKRINETQYNNLMGEHSSRVIRNDRFGNIFPTPLTIKSTFSDGDKYQKIDGTFATLSVENNEECFMAINDIVYKTKYTNPMGTENNTPIKRWYLNENSEFIEIKNLEKIMSHEYEEFSREEDILKAYDTTYRLLFNKEEETGYDGGQVTHQMKCDFVLHSCQMMGVTDLEVVNKEQVVYSKTYKVYGGSYYSIFNEYTALWADGVKDFVFFNGIVIGKVGDEIITVNTNDGSTVSIFGNYDIKDYYYSKQLDCLKFTAIDKTTLLEVDGFYNKDGKVSVGELPTDMASLKKIYSIAPLN